MSIFVLAHDLVSSEFPSATGWHIDDSGYLHIKKDGHGNVASFHADSWRAVQRDEDCK